MGSYVLSSSRPFLTREASDAQVARRSPTSSRSARRLSTWTSKSQGKRGLSNFYHSELKEL